eukprot:gene32947-40669_t
MSAIGPPEIPDFLGMKEAFEGKKAVVPWKTDVPSASLKTEVLFKAASAPHIVLFVVDDWGYNDIGYQSTYLGWTTPNIDKLAKGGIKLTNYFTHEYCVPSRAALMTGRYALRFGMHEEANDYVELPSTEATMADELRTAGYRTNMVGKWHLGYSSTSKTPTYRGFDYFYGYYNGYMDYWTKMYHSWYGNWRDLHEGTETVDDEYATDVTTHSAYLYTSKAIAIMEDHAANYADQPMFLYFASQLLHSEYEAPPVFIAKCAAINPMATADQKAYCAMNLMLDETVGNITCALEANGMSDNTLFVLVSDNGGVSDMTGSNYPYRGYKHSTFRGGTSVQGFIYGSESVIPKSRRGSTYSGMMHVTDWLPTLMGLATDNAWTGSYKSNTIDGADMWSAVINDTATAHDEIVLFMDSDGSFVVVKDMVKMSMFITNDTFAVMEGYHSPDYKFKNGPKEFSVDSVQHQAPEEAV